MTTRAVAAAATVAELAQRRWGDRRTGLQSRGTVLTHHDVAAGAAVAGINPTRRGAELARPIVHTE